MYKKLLLTVVLILVSAVVAFPQDLVLEPSGASPAQVARDTLLNEGYLGIIDRVSTGLENVGVESKVFLTATFEDSFRTGIVWTMIDQPSGSEGYAKGVKQKGH